MLTTNDEPKIIQYRLGESVNVSVEFLSEISVTLEIKCITQTGDVVKIVTKKEPVGESVYIKNEAVEPIKMASEFQEPDE